MTSPAPHIPNCEYSPHKRTRIVVGYELGLSRRELALKEGVNPASISKIVKRYKQQTSGKSLPLPGRPRVLDERDIRRILRLIRIEPLITLEKLRRDLSLSCSARTVGAELKRRGVKLGKNLVSTPESSIAALRALTVQGRGTTVKPSFLRTATVVCRLWRPDGVIMGN